MQLRALVGVMAVCLLVMIGCDAKAKEAPVVTPEEIIGKWVVDASSVRDVAFNYAKKQSQRMGLRLRDSDIEEHMGELFKAIVKNPPEFYFKEDGKFTIKNKTASANGTWTIQGDIVSMLEKGDTKPILLKYNSGFLTSMPDSGLRKIDLVKR